MFCLPKTAWPPTFWFLKSLPSRIGNLLDITLKDLEKVLYCESYIVIDPKETTFTRGELLSEDRYQKALDEFGDEAFSAGMGGEAVLELLRRVGPADKKHGEGVGGLANELRAEVGS